MQQTKKKKYICNNAIWVLSILNNMYNNLKQQYALFTTHVNLVKLEGVEEIKIMQIIICEIKLLANDRNDRQRQSRFEQELPRVHPA